MFLLSISPATWFSNDNAKILQTRAKSSSLLECSAERRWILCKDTARFPSMQWNTYCRVSQSFISHVSTYCLLRPHTIFVISFVLFLALSLYDLTAVLTELFFVLLFPFLLFSHLCLAGVSFQTAVLMSFFLYFNCYDSIWYDYIRLRFRM